MIKRQRDVSFVQYATDNGCVSKCAIEFTYTDVLNSLRSISHKVCCLLYEVILNFLFKYVYSGYQSDYQSMQREWVLLFSSSL